MVTRLKLGVEDAGGICLDGRALVAGGIGGSPGGRLVLCVIGVSSMFGGIICIWSNRNASGSRKWWLRMIRW